MIRCILGTTLRLAVYGSILNLALSFAGKTEGFWATKVCPSFLLCPRLQFLPLCSRGSCPAIGHVLAVNADVHKWPCVPPGSLLGSQQGLDKGKNSCLEVEDSVQVVTISTRSTKKLFTSRFNIKETIEAGKAASREVCTVLPRSFG